MNRRVYEVAKIGCFYIAHKTVHAIRLDISTACVYFCWLNVRILGKVDGCKYLAAVDVLFSVNVASISSIHLIHTADGIVLCHSLLFTCQPVWTTEHDELCLVSLIS